jgi:hypothetical protein
LYVKARFSQTSLEIGEFSLCNRILSNLWCRKKGAKYERSLANELKLSLQGIYFSLGYQQAYFISFLTAGAHFHINLTP